MSFELTDFKDKRLRQMVQDPIIHERSFRDYLSR